MFVVSRKYPFEIKKSVNIFNSLSESEAIEVQSSKFIDYYQDRLKNDDYSTRYSRMSLYGVIEKYEDIIDKLQNKVA